MSIRIQGKRLAANLTAAVGILSAAAAGVASIALWYQTEQAKAASSASSGLSGSTQQQPPGFSSDGGDSGQQSAPVGPSQNFAPLAQSSGS